MVFDLDDTLMRERDFCRSGFRAIERDLCRRFGPGYLGVALRMNSRLIRRENYFALLEEILQNDVKEYLELYRTHRPERLDFAPGGRELLDALKEKGVVMALVTDGRSLTQRRKIEALGLDEYIPGYNIYISEERGADKTNPASFRDIVRRYPEARRFIYIGDNLRKDFIIPTLLGWETVLISRNSDNVHERIEISDKIQVEAFKMLNFSQILTELKL